MGSRKILLIIVCLIFMLSAVGAEAGLFFRQGRGFFPNARGVAGRVGDRQSRRVNRRSTRQAYRGYGYNYNYRCINCNKTKATAIPVS
jgi:hypothetical protein